MNLLQQTDVFGVCSWRGFVPGGKQKAKEIDFDFDFDDLEAEAKLSIILPLKVQLHPVAW